MTFKSYFTGGFLYIVKIRLFFENRFFGKEGLKRYYRIISQKKLKRIKKTRSANKHTANTCPTAAL